MLPETNPAPGYLKYPDHEVKIEKFIGEVIVSADGTEVARSKNALVVRESNHAEVHYLPLDDVTPSFLRDSNHVTRCPFKGKARYWNIMIGDHEIDNALWGYEMPYDEALELAGMVAFYPNKVRIDVLPLLD